MRILTMMAFCLSIFTFSMCTAQSETASPDNPTDKKERKRKTPPTVDEVFTKHDANKDGKLAKDEIDGRLLNDFDNIDANKDGFISREELENAPRPKRGGKRPKKEN